MKQNWPGIEGGFLNELAGDRNGLGSSWINNGFDN